jgi:ascorbate-specific PTS system EIIC-type component UlaA
MRYFCITQPSKRYGNECTGFHIITIGHVTVLAIWVTDFCGFHIGGEETRGNFTHIKLQLNIFSALRDSSGIPAIVSTVISEEPDRMEN